MNYCRTLIFIYFASIALGTGIINNLFQSEQTVLERLFLVKEKLLLRKIFGKPFFSYLYFLSYLFFINSQQKFFLLLLYVFLKGKDFLYP